MIDIQDKEDKLVQMKNSLKRYHHLFEYNINNRLSEHEDNNNYESLKENEHIIINAEGNLEQIRPTDKIDFDEIMDLQNNAKLRSCSSKTQFSNSSNENWCCIIF